MRFIVKEYGRVKPPSVHRCVPVLMMTQKSRNRNLNQISMKKSFSRVIAVSFAIVVLISLSSCGSSRGCKKLPTYGWYK